MQILATLLQFSLPLLKKCIFFSLHVSQNPKNGESNLSILCSKYPFPDIDKLGYTDTEESLGIQWCNKRCMGWHKLPVVAVTVIKLYPTPFIWFIFPFHIFTPICSIHRFPGRRQMVSRDSEHIRNSQVSDLLPTITEGTHSSHMAANKLHAAEIPGSVCSQYTHIDLISRKTALHVLFASWKCLSSSEIPRHTNLTTGGSNTASEKHSSQQPAFSWLHL